MTLTLLILSIVINITLTFFLVKKERSLTELKVKHKAVQDYAERIASRYIKRAKRKTANKEK